MRRHRIRHAGGFGFTLVELLVAISILAIVAVLGWRGLDGIMRARISLTDQMEMTRGMQLAFAQMQNDCENLAADGILNGRPYLQAENDSLTVVRRYFAENEPMLLQVVSYRVREGMLIRRESAGTRDLIQLDVMWKAATSNADSAVPVTLQSGVGGMQVQGWANGEWQSIRAPLAGVQVPGQPPQPGNTDGLQVVLEVSGQAAPMVKTFLMGGT
jgi:general secretion pathway protein J